MVRNSPPSSNDATVTSKRSWKCREEATASALAAEYEEFDLNNDVEERDDEVDRKQRMMKCKSGPMALALAEYNETGEIDSSIVGQRKKGRGDC